MAGTTGESGAPLPSRLPAAHSPPVVLTAGSPQSQAGGPASPPPPPASQSVRPLQTVLCYRMSVQVDADAVQAGA